MDDDESNFGKIGNKVVYLNHFGNKKGVDAMAKRRGIGAVIRDFMLYFSRNFDSLQKDEILQGRRQGLDTSVYSSKDYDWMKMREIRLGLEKGVDISGYAKLGMDSEQLEELRMGLEKGLDVSFYNKKDFDWGQMREIRLGLEKGLEVNYYAKSDLNTYQMEEIRFGLEKGLDVSYFNRSNFDWQQMREIRLGLERGIDVSTYAKQQLPVEQMEKIRLKLQKEMKEQEAYLISKEANKSTKQQNNVHDSTKDKEKTRDKDKAKEEAAEKGNEADVKSAEDKKATGVDKGEFKLSKFDVNVIFKAITKYPTTELLQAAAFERFNDPREAQKQVDIYQKEIKKLIQHDYVGKKDDEFYITPKGFSEAKEVSREFEFTTYDTGKVFPYIIASGGKLTRDMLAEQLGREYTKPEEAVKQLTYILKRLDNNVEYGTVYKDDNGAYSITKLGERLAREINISVEEEMEAVQEL